MNREEQKAIIKTSQQNWLENALKLYTEKKTFTLIDDAGIGLTEDDLKTAVTLIKAAKEKHGMSRSNIVAALAGIGITGLGIWMVFAAIADPEPTSKLGLLIVGGIIITLTGSLGTLAALGIKFSVSAKSPQGHAFEIRPEK